MVVHVEVALVFVVSVERGIDADVPGIDAGVLA